jgi:hypothetical protein
MQRWLHKHFRPFPQPSPGSKGLLQGGPSPLRTAPRPGHGERTC